MVENKKKILALLDSGLYASKIAKLLNLSRSAISQYIRKLEQERLVIKSNTYPIFYTLTDQGKVMIGNVESVKQIMNGLNLTKQVHSSHKIKFSVSYEGSQPISGALAVKKFGRTGTARQAIYKYSGGLTIITFKKKLNIWVHHPKGISTNEQMINAKANAYMMVLQFAKEYDLKITTTIEKVIQSHHVIENKDLNELLKPIFSKYKYEIKEQIGSAICQTSHKGKIEHEGNQKVQGSDVAKGLEYLTIRFPNDFAKVAEQQNRYDENIRKHLKVLSKMERVLSKLEKKF